jgi:hypothetical protein
MWTWPMQEVKCASMEKNVALLTYSKSSATRIGEVDGLITASLRKTKKCLQLFKPSNNIGNCC